MKQSPFENLQLQTALKSIAYSILSGILLAIPFLNGKLWIFAWFGFIPLFFAIRNKTPFNPDFALGFEENGLNPCSDKACEQKNRRRIQCNTPRTLLRAERSQNKELETFYQNPNANSGFKSFLFGYLAGIIFWAGAIYWLVHVTLLGQILLILYLALYFGVFGLAVSLLTLNPYAFTLVAIPSSWVILEYLRSHLLTGFGWALLGYSQYLNLPIIQIADIFGVYGVSFLIMMVNVAVYSVFSCQFSVVRKKYVLTIFLLLSSVLGYGYYHLHNTQYTIHNTPVKISVVQGNIPQELKWVRGQEPFILDRYSRLTEIAALEKPDLIIWPEAAAPGLLGEDDWVFEEIFALAKKVNIPLMVGSAVKENRTYPITDFDGESSDFAPKQGRRATAYSTKTSMPSEPDEGAIQAPNLQPKRSKGIGSNQYFNSGLLINNQGVIVSRYDKLHLVPFGEYIPLKNTFRFLETIVPIGDFNAGKEYTIFKLQAPSSKLWVNFAVLICFEDTIPELAGNFVKSGAAFLINITNDGWFGRTAAASQHLAASVFRAVENRVSVVRSANTGISCFIDSCGRIKTKVSENGRDIFIQGFKTETIMLSKQDSPYRHIGDGFVLACLAVVAFCGIISVKRISDKRKR